METFFSTDYTIEFLRHVTIVKWKVFLNDFNRLFFLVSFQGFIGEFTVSRYFQHWCFSSLLPVCQPIWWQWLIETRNLLWNIRLHWNEKMLSHEKFLNNCQMIRRPAAKRRMNEHYGRRTKLQTMKLLHSQFSITIPYFWQLFCASPSLFSVPLHHLQITS